MSAVTADISSSPSVFIRHVGRAIPSGTASAHQQEGEHERKAAHAPTSLDRRVPEHRRPVFAMSLDGAWWQRDVAAHRCMIRQALLKEDACSRARSLLGDHDRLHVHELTDAEASVLPAIAARLDTAERKVRLCERVTVDVDHAGVEVLSSKLDSALLIA